MIKKLIEITILAISITGLIYLLNNIGPLGAEAKVALKYLWLGILGVTALSIIAITILGLAAIIFGISWLKGITSPNPSAKNYNSSLGGFISKVVGDATKEAFNSIKDFKNFSSRNITIPIEKYSYHLFKLKNASGDIKIHAGEGENISGEIEILEKEENDAEIYFENGELKIKTRSGKKGIFGDVEIYLPKNLSLLDIESINGDITVTGFNTSQESFIKGVNGDIFITDLANSKEISIKTVNGDIRIKDSRFNSIISQSVSGDIVLKETSAENAILKTVSGDIDYRESSIKNPSVKTVSGEIKR